MPDKAPVVPKSDADVTPAPVEVVASIPISVQIAPESLASLGAPPAGTAEPVKAPPTGTPIDAFGQAQGTPAAPQGQATTTTVTTTAPPVQTVVKGEGVTLAPRTTEQEDIVVGRQAEIGKIWEWTQSVLSVLITAAVIYAELTGISSVTLGNAFFFVVSLYLIRTNHVKIGGIGPKANELPYQGR